LSKKSWLAFSALLGGLMTAYAWWIEPGRLSITSQEVSDPEKPLQTPIRLLLLTDWHLGRFSRPQALRTKMQRLQKMHAKTPVDLVLLGGDYVDVEPRFLSKMLPILESLKEFGVPIYGVLGNHDYTSYDGDVSPVIACLESCGVTVLRNTAKVLTVREQRLAVIGLDDMQESPAYYARETYRTPKQYQEAAAQMDWYAKFDEFEPEVPRVLLSHNPDAVYLPGRVPLAVLAGHTHGGQVMLLDWVSRLLHRWIHPALPPGSAVTWAGRRDFSGRTLIVSRGMEGSAVPLRLLRTPEAVLVILH
jgi:predicted MPP superfamily phosphohydrolase